MLERITPVLRVVCLVLAGLVIYQLAGLLTHKSSLSDLRLEPIALASTAQAAPAKAGTNSASGPGGVSSPAARKQSDLPPAIQARIDKITQSELLGTIVRPQPMVLLGIAGNDAFIRTPSGQTGMLREGEEIGGVKLLRIGTNRVLVEYEQQKKELTVFAGFGGDSLLPKGEKNSQ